MTTDWWNLPSPAELAHPDPLRFTVYGHPQPAGSKRGFPVRKAGKLTGRVAIVDDNPRSRDWKQQTSAAAADAMAGLFGPDWDDALMVGPLALDVLFVLARPAYHYGTGRNAERLKPGYAFAPAPVTRPDCTKLLRAVEDALTGIVWRDDAQVIEQRVRKLYGSPERAEVVVWRR